VEARVTATPIALRVRRGLTVLHGLSQISGWDHFHPNAAGPAALAATSYGAGFNW
jgi:hypothetical protein